MRVLIVADLLNNPRSAGVQRYTRELISALARRGDVEVTALCDDPLHARGLDPAARCRVRGPLRGRWDRLARCVLPSPWLRDFDVVHCPTHVGPFLRIPRGTRLVVTLHDLVPILFPATAVWANRFWFQRLLPRLIHRYDHVIADSRCTRDDIIGRLGVDPGRVSVVPLASSLAPDGSAAGDGGDDCLLAVGTIEPRKNLARVIEAFVRVLDRRPDLRTRLVLLGHWGWQHASFRRTIERAGSRVELAGYVSDAELQRRYGRAKGLVFASLYEGFGLPVLEAMSCGCPVIASDRSSLPEVGGDAALYVDPESVESIAGAIERLLDDAELRRSMRERGFAQAARFSWDRVAEETVAVYRLAIERPAGPAG